MHITNITEAKASLSKLIEKALRGEEVIIGKAGKPIVKIVPYEIDTSPRLVRRRQLARPHMDCG